MRIFFVLLILNFKLIIKTEIIKLPINGFEHIYASPSGGKDEEHFKNNPAVSNLTRSGKIANRKVLIKH